MRYLQFFILLFFLFLIQCSSLNYITKPSALPDNYYYDKEALVIFKNPGTVDDYIRIYSEWKINNPIDSFLKRYTDIFKLYPENIKKDFDVNGDGEGDYFVVSKKPKLLDREPPKIPKSAFIQNRNRLIVVSILLEKNGVVVAAQLFDITDKISQNHKKITPYVDAQNLTKADKEMIYESLISAINFKFTPAEQKGKKVRVIMNVPLTFSFK